MANGLRNQPRPPPPPSEILGNLPADKPPTDRPPIVGGGVNVETREEREFVQGGPDVEALAKRQLAEQQAAIDAARKNIEQTLPEFNKTTQFIGPSADPAQAKAAAETIRTQTEQFKSEAEDALVELSTIKGKGDVVFAQAIKSQQEILKNLGDRAPSLKKELKSAQENFEKANKALQDAEFDPNKLLATMPSWARVLTAMATSFDSLANSLGVGTGQPRIAAVINAAIARDQQDQLKALNVRMRKLGVADEQRRFALQRMDAFQAQQRQAAALLTQTQLARLSSESNSVKTRLDIAKTVNQISSSGLTQALSVEARGRGRVQTTKSTNQQRQKALANLALSSPTGAADSATADPVLIRRDQEALAAAVNARGSLGVLLDNVIKQRKRFGGGLTGGSVAKLSSIFGFTDASATQGFIDRLALEVSKAANGGRPTDKDTERVQRSFPKLFSTNAAARQAARNTIGEVFRKIEAQAVVAAQNGRMKQAINLSREAKNLRRMVIDMQNKFSFSN